MNKQALIAKIAEDTGSSKAGAAAAVESLIEGITKSLKKGESITFVGFGTFKTAQRKARTARNPQTGATIKIPKRRVIVASCLRFTLCGAVRQRDEQRPRTVRHRDESGAQKACASLTRLAMLARRNAHAQYLALLSRVRRRDRAHR